MQYNERAASADAEALAAAIRKIVTSKNVQVFLKGDTEQVAIQGTVVCSIRNGTAQFPDVTSQLVAAALPHPFIIRWICAHVLPHLVDWSEIHLD